MALDVSRAGTTWGEPRFNMEEIIQVYNALTDENDDIHWKKGQLLSKLASYKIKLNWLSAQTGESPAQLRELKKTYEVFEDESTRVPTLSWYHHRIAAGTDMPQYWISYAAEKNLSTRELKYAIKTANGEIADDDQRLEREGYKVMKKIEDICQQNMRIGKALLCDIIDYARDLGIT